MKKKQKIEERRKKEERKNKLDIQTYLNKESKKINKALEIYLPKAGEHPAHLVKAMRYAVLSGGKRVRPILALAACQAVGGNEKKVLPAACAIEIIHNYSLVHDDLPSMDNDDFRRGAPTCHKKFGEDTAILAGDALLALAFKILSQPDGARAPKDFERQSKAAYLIAEAIGTHGMVGGQAVDMEFKKKEPDLPTIEYINTHKSGALIAVSTRVGAYLGGGSKGQVEALYRYGKYTGLLFQIVDDILDREGYAKVIGVPEAKKQAEGLLNKAKKELKIFGPKGIVLSQLADFVLTRRH